MTPIAGPLLRSVTGILVFCFFIPVLPACQDTLSCANLNKKTRNALDSFDLETAYYWMAKALNACAPPHYKAKKGFLQAICHAGEYYYYMGNLDSADYWFDEGLVKLKESKIKDLKIHASLLIGKGSVYIDRSNFVKAENSQIQALRDCAKIKYPN